MMRALAVKGGSPAMEFMKRCLLTIDTAEIASGERMSVHPRLQVASLDDKPFVYRYEYRTVP